MKTLLLALILLSFANGAWAESLIVSVDEWCPYICLNEKHTALDTEAPGYYPAIIDAIFLPRGYEIRYLVRPWKRAIQETRSGVIDAILSPAINEAPDFVFPEESIGSLCWCFFTRKENKWTYKDPQSLASETIGYLDGNAFNEKLDAYLEKNKKTPHKVQPVHGLNFLRINVVKLMGGRITAFIDESASTNYFLYKNGMTREIREAGCLEHQAMYMAFSPAHEESVKHAQLFSAGLRELRQSGRLEAILSAYGLKDWVEDAIQDK